MLAHNLFIEIYTMIYSIYYHACMYMKYACHMPVHACVPNINILYIKVVIINKSFTIYSSCMRSRGSTYTDLVKCSVCGMQAAVHGVHACCECTSYQGCS